MLNLPNSTQIPNEIINGWLPKLSGAEYKVLTIIARQTLGWIENEETGMRKEEDWMTQKQLMEKTGLKKASIARAIKELVEKNLIEVRDKNKNILKTAEERRIAGRNHKRLYYRLKLKASSKSELELVQKVNKASSKSEHYKTKLYKTNLYKIKENIKRKEIFEKIFKAWNEEGIIVHRSLDVSLKRKINARLREGVTALEIIRAIKNYGQILRSNDYYFKYKWTLKDFLQRGFEKFRDWKVADSNYRRNGFEGKPRVIDLDK